MIAVLLFVVFVVCVTGPSTLWEPCDDWIGAPSGRQNGGR